MIWNSKAYNYQSQQTLKKDGTITYEKTGCWVMTIEEAWQALKKQKGW